MDKTTSIKKVGSDLLYRRSFLESLLESSDKDAFQQKIIHQSVFG